MTSRKNEKNMKVKILMKSILKVAALLLVGLTATAIIMAINARLPRAVLYVIAALCIVWLVYHFYKKPVGSTRKTPQQVMEWLQAQEWYPKFVENYSKCKWNDGRDIECFVKEFYDEGKGEDLICGAFVWNATREGLMYWGRVDGKFRKWYNKEEAK